MIADSGQCFRLHETAEAFVAPSGERLLMLKKDAERLASVDMDADTLAYWQRYFDMDTDYESLRAAADPFDTYLCAAAEAGCGLRILRQEPFETLISFILSTRKNIPAIRGSVEALCRRFGRPLSNEVYAFPTPAALAAASIEELNACSLGYRSRYVKETAERIALHMPDLTLLAALPDDELIAALSELSGVGIKVASCVALFAYHRLDAFPRDVWMERVLARHYADGFPYARYAGFAGLMQQYLFRYARTEGLA